MIVPDSMRKAYVMSLEECLLESNNRKVIITDSGQRLNRQELVQLTADCITKGDPRAYCKMLRERIDARKSRA